MDLVVPPLSLLAILVILTFIVSVISILFADMQKFFYFIGIIQFIFFFTVFLAWQGFGRKYLSFYELAYLPIMVLKKIPLYLQYAFNRQKKWVRTERN